MQSNIGEKNIHLTHHCLNKLDSMFTLTGSRRAEWELERGVAVLPGRTVSPQRGTALTRFNLSATVGAAECARGSRLCLSAVTWVSSVSKVEIRSTSNSSEGNRISVHQTRCALPMSKM
ncbi:unnamed protein product [Acanthoscelides obtectus]|uniref:Uncharacterized protein n=1 Tax=Acanthoscelides obtectus TaxID=200917 RepID=A0A9P0Q9K5_ACAOB|nr:unnamed protein product [Acanthoscelides obtectus]CAK1682391.1 hypothetical protein AOBTE_LOCUS33597 [Acanthoscelides obtectus]